MKTSIGYCCWDFHGVLEKGGEVALKNSINTVLRRVGSERSVTTEELKKLYGQPIGTFVTEFFPLGTDVSKTSREIDDTVLSFVPSNVTAMDYASDVLRKIKKRGDKNIILSGSTTELYVEKYLGLIGLTGCVSGIYATSAYNKLLQSKEYFSGNPEQVPEEWKMFYSGMRELAKQLPKGSGTTEDFKEWFLAALARPSYVNRIAMVDDSETGMLAVENANHRLDEEYGQLERLTGAALPKKRITGILFDPSGKKNGVEASYRIRDLRQALDIFYRL